MATMPRTEYVGARRVLMTFAALLVPALALWFAFNIGSL